MMNGATPDPRDPGSQSRFRAMKPGIRGKVRQFVTGASTATGEDALVVLLLAGDGPAFAGLVKAHHASLVRVAQAFVGAKTIAEEVAQETWQSVLEHLDSFERRSSLRTWIFRICSNKAKTRAKRESRVTHWSALDDGEAGPAVDAERFDAGRRWSDPPAHFGNRSPEQILQRTEALEQLRLAFDQLPQAQRAVITLRDVQGFDPDETCTILEISESNQRVLLHRARSKVRKALEDAYGE